VVLRREIEHLPCGLIRARTELRTKTQYAGRLEYLLRSRTARIDRTGQCRRRAARPKQTA
jgi:hypothetical protein